MKNEIIKPEVAKTAEFLQCSLISADFLKIKKGYKSKINKNATYKDHNSFVVSENLSENHVDLEIT